MQQHSFSAVVCFWLFQTEIKMQKYWKFMTTKCLRKPPSPPTGYCPLKSFCYICRHCQIRYSHFPNWPRKWALNMVVVSDLTHKERVTANNFIYFILLHFIRNFLKQFVFSCMPNTVKSNLVLKLLFPCFLSDEATQQYNLGLYHVIALPSNLLVNFLPHKFRKNRELSLMHDTLTST